MKLPASYSEPAEHPIPETRAVHVEEVALSYILRVGVITSIAIVLFGAILTFAHHEPDYVGHSRPLNEVAKVSEPFPHTLSATLSAIHDWRGKGFVVLGLLVLLMTPIVSVTVAIGAFAIQKNKAFAIFAAIVLAILILSLILGKAEGG